MDIETSVYIYSTGMHVVETPMWIGIMGALTPIIVILAAFVATSLKFPARPPALPTGHTRAELEAAARELEADPDPLLRKLNALETSSDA